MRKINRKWVLPRAFFVFFLLLTPFLEPLFIRGQDKFRVGSTVVDKLAYMGKKLYAKEQGPIDILFLGASELMTDVNARVVAETLGIEAENFGHFAFGVEADYMLLKEAVKTRGVKNVILVMRPDEVEIPHKITRPLWNPWSETLPLSIFTPLLAEKTLYSLQAMIKSFYFRPDESHIMANQIHHGSQIQPYAFSEDEEGINMIEPFQRIPLRPKPLMLDDLLISRSSDVFQYEGTYTEFFDFYFHQLISLAKSHRINLYYLYLPSIQESIAVNKIPAMKFITDPDPSTPTLAITPERLFGTSSREAMKAYFSNAHHMNENGMNHFTYSILPALKEIHEKSVR